jgi:hypothetical protein
MAVLKLCENFEVDTSQEMEGLKKEKLVEVGRALEAANLASQALEREEGHAESQARLRGREGDLDARLQRQSPQCSLQCLLQCSMFT